ncbi:MAG: DUF5131 family protein [Chitinivibrionales bacterium]
MLQKPLTWKKPRMIFVNSMSDAFHEHISAEQILNLLNAIKSSGRIPLRRTG